MNSVIGTQSLLMRGIGDLMQSDVSTVKFSASAKEALNEFKRSKYGAVYVVDDQTGALRGVITGYDLGKFATSEGAALTAAQLATTEKVVAVRRDAELWQLLKIMNGENAVRRQLERLPVLDDHNRPVGIVDRSALRTSLSSFQIPASGSAFTL